MKREQQSGFSVIEALVAVAIIAVAILPLASLQGQVSRTAGRQQQAQLSLAAERSAMAALRDLNVMETPDGALELGGDRVLRWQAHPISSAAATNSGEFSVALYAVQAQVADHRGREIAKFSVDQVGWRRADAS
ncbi:MAG: prepilin-type N-terminal cleavage/methylation domain-containing protein [Terricaulis sp.]